MGKPGYFVGVDGGATRCRARLRDASGRALAQCVGPAANVYVNFNLGLGVVREIVERTVSEAGLASVARDQMALGLGLAGLSNAADAFRVTSGLPGWARVDAVNDAVTACIGANGLTDGGLVIAGTGSAGVARVGGATTIIGGRGFLLGDEERERALGGTRSGPRYAHTTASNR